MNEGKMEEMLVSLMTMVGGMNEKQQDVQQEQKSMSKKLQTVVEDQIKVRESQSIMSEKMNEIINK